MSTAAEKTAQWIERGSDLANPILVRETRQALKSRQFVATFMLLLGAAWMVSSFFMLWSGDALEYGAIAMELFLVYYVVLAFAIFVIVPFGAYRSLLNENDLNTFDLLSITTLSPSNIVWGKLWTATVQVFIYYSAIAPFMAFTALLNGFDFAKFAFVLVLSKLASIAACLIALTLSTFAKQRHWQALSSLVLLGGLVWLFMGALGLAFQMLWFSPPFTDPEFWWSLAAIIMVVASYLALCLQITTAQLTFESDNRSSGIRVVASLQVFLFVVCVGIFFWANSIYPPAEALMVLSLLAITHVGVIGLFAVTEFEALSRRIRRGLPENPVLRLCLAPYLPGGSRGLIYTFAHLAVIVGSCWLVLELFRGMISRRWLGASVEVFGVALQPPVPILLAVSLYLVIFLCIASWLSRIGQRVSSDLRPAHARVITVLVFMAGVLLPFLPRMMKWIPWGPFDIIDIFNPMLSLQHIDRAGSESELLFLLLILAAFVSIAANARAIYFGFRDIVEAHVTDARLIEEFPESGLDEPVADRMIAATDLEIVDEA